MKGEARKAAIAAAKERKSAGGVYSVRNTTSGETWVGRCPNVDAITARLRFMLDHGTDPLNGLREAWRRDGEAAFAIDILEAVDPDEPPYRRNTLLKERTAHWRETLGAHLL